MKKELIDIMGPLFRIYSPFGQEAVLSEYISAFLSASGFVVNRDLLGNIMACRGDGNYLPLLNAHMDTCQDESDRYLLDRVCYDPSEDRFRLKGVQIGCDDKAGLAVAMCLAKCTDLMFKVLFTVQEEHGQIGVKHVPADFYKDVMWAFTLDRRGASDIITWYNGREMCSAGFLRQLISIAKEEGSDLAVSTGTIADTFHIAEHCQAVNLSTGYYGAHRKNDYVKVEETYRMLCVVLACLRNKEILEAAGSVPD